jgi:hypothetical protein
MTLDLSQLSQRILWRLSDLLEKEGARYSMASRCPDKRHPDSQRLRVGARVWSSEERAVWERMAEQVRAAHDVKTAEMER